MLLNNKTLLSLTLLLKIHHNMSIMLKLKKNLEVMHKFHCNKFFNMLSLNY